MKLLSFFAILTFSYANGLVDDHCSQRVANAKGITEKCSKQLQKLCGRHDLLLALWDASSKQLHAGLTATNNEDLGNFDLCMSIDAKVDDVEILGKYCPFQWATQLPKSTLEELVVALEEYNPPYSVDKNELSEIQNRTFLKNVVKYGVEETEIITMVGSLCIADGCSPEEFAEVFNPYIIPVTYSARNATTNCFVNGDTQKMTTFQIGVTVCIGLIILIILVATAYHIWIYNMNEAHEPPELVKAFSILHNGTKLITISRSNPDQIQCIHGLRFLSMLWVIAGHTFSCVESYPLFNIKHVLEWRSKLYAQYILAGPFAVDTFFFLSGLLLAYGYMKQMKGVDAMKQIKTVPLMIVQRYLRLTPAAAALFFVTLTMEPLGNGPLWILMLNVINQPCRDYWWRYFLYIQNYSKDICYTQTWYLSADMQMFVLAPIVLIPAAIYFRKNLRVVVYSLAGLTIFCVGLTIGIRYIVNDYALDYDTHSRLSDYLVGIIGGIIMHTQRGRNIKLNKVVNFALWIISLAIMLFLALYLHDILENPTKDKENFFYPIQRPIWCTCIFWIVFSSHNGYGGTINRFLSNSFFQIGSRLSYCIYIIHASVILYFSGQIRTYQFVSDYTIIYWLCGNVVFCMAVATIWTLVFEAPMIILTKMILGKLGAPKK